MKFSELTGYVMEMGYTEEDLEENLIGQTREEIVASWGESDMEHTDFLGDTWMLDDNRGKRITLYYDENEYEEKAIYDVRKSR